MQLSKKEYNTGGTDVVSLFGKIFVRDRIFCIVHGRGGNNRPSESEVSFMQNEKQNKTNMGPQDKTNGQNPQNKKKDQAQNKSSRPEQY